MKLNQSTVGPIIGHTTGNQTRIFLRGDAQRDGNDFRRCFAVVRWRAVGAKAWSSPLFNKLSPNFDMTGVLVVSNLKAATTYEYQCGWFFAEAELALIAGWSDKQIEWPPEGGPSDQVFRTMSDDVAAPRSYIVGSCRYLLRLFGGTWFDDRGDKAFRSVLEQITDGKKPQPVDALLMIGDQIYADDLNVLTPDTRLDEFLGRYRTVFTQDNVRRLMARVPTYMMLDDHEIEDNWPAKASEQDRVTLYPHAIHAYQIYQCSHSPLFDVTKDGRIDGTLTHFWYSFGDAAVEWFVMDTRTERICGVEPVLANEAQMTALLKWLADGSGKVKFVVSSVPVFPDANTDSTDMWSGFPAQRARLLGHIRTQKVRKVIFVSGDVHCSFTSELRCADDPDFLVNAIVSSSFFWPYPHTEIGDFHFGEPLSGIASANYITSPTSKVFSTDNFARITVVGEKVSVAFFERKGAQLGKTITLRL